MADIRPFRGIRPRNDLVERLASPPYDVMSADEARAMAAGNPISFLHVVRAEIDLPPDCDPHGDVVYRKSADNLQRLIRSGSLVQDSRPCFYIYQLTMGDHVQHGLVIGASVEEYETGGIKKHELTRRDKEDDRARHVEQLMANTGPVLLTYRAVPTISETIRTLTARQRPDYDFVADDGVGHRLWVVDDPAAVEQLHRAFDRVEAFYIADGHHRSASAYRVRDLLRDKNPGHTGREPYNHFLAVAFPDDELNILGYNRVVGDLAGLEPAALLEKVRESFDVAGTDVPQPPASRQFGMYLDGKWYRLTPHADIIVEDDPVRSLDVSILQEHLLGPILGIGDPRTDERIQFVGGIRGTEELERRCAGHGADHSAVAFALYPVSVAQLMAISDHGAIMPPKSTWFEPKLRSGMVVRSLEGSE
jgi:uncharacterized protein (DUF1015 family)